MVPGTRDVPVEGGEKVVVVRVDDGARLSDAMHEGLARATGEFVAFLEPGDSVAATAVAAFEAVATEPTAMIYSDEIRRGAAFAKPDFSPERLRSQFYLGRVTAFRRSLVESLGGIRSGIDGAEEYDLALRVARASRAVAHIPAALVAGDGPRRAEDWGIAPNVEAAATRKVLSEHLAATGGGTVEEVSPSGIHRTRRPVHGAPLVSIVIPTRGSSASVRGESRCMVVEALRSIVEVSTYANLEFVIVIDDVAGDDVRSELTKLGGARLIFVEWERPFSFSEKVNLGVLHARGEFVLLLNDDVEVITPGWVEAMLALAQLPGAGLVGSMLYYEDDTIQHAGHAYYRLDVTHIGLGSERGAAGPWGGFLVEREVAGVTCACALVRKSVFVEAGGLSTLLPGNFNDVDLCMKVSTLGYQSYWTPFAELYHFESKSRNPRVAKSEIDTTWRRWEHEFWYSPFWPTDPHEVFPREAAM